MQYIVVFDTNILLSALLSTNGNPFRCLALARIGQVESVTCQEVLDEFNECETQHFQAELTIELGFVTQPNLRKLDRSRL